MGTGDSKLMRLRYLFLLALLISSPLSVGLVLSWVTPWSPMRGHYALESCGMAVFTIFMVIATRVFSIDIGLGEPAFRRDGLLKAACIFSLFSVAISLGVFLIAGQPLVIYYGPDLIGNVDLAIWFILSAVIEEVIFRGVLLRVFIPFLGRWGGLILQALCFAYTHKTQGSLSFFLWYVYFGMTLGAMTLVTKSLIPAVLVHCAWNLVMATCMGMIQVIKPGSFGLIVNVGTSDTTQVRALAVMALALALAFSLYLYKMNAAAAPTAPAR